MSTRIRRTSRLLSACLGLAAALGLSSCCCKPDGAKCQQPPPGDEIEPVIGADHVGSPGRGCTNRRWVGHVVVPLDKPHYQACPEPRDGRWVRVATPYRVEPFTREIEGHGAPSGQNELMKTVRCTYQWAGRPWEKEAFAGEMVPHGLPARGDTPFTGWLHRDCSVVAPFWNTFPTKSNAATYRLGVWEPKRDSFLNDMKAARPRPGTGKTITPRPVYVAVVDTADSDCQPLAELHGRIVSRVINRLACLDSGPVTSSADFPGNGPPNKAGCGVEVVQFKALTLTEPHQLDKGPKAETGYFGYQGRVSEAIDEALVRWKQWRALGSGDQKTAPLVINLSIGWDGRYNSPAGKATAGHSKTMAEPAAITLHSIRRAVCEGALVIAAAGNTSGEDPAAHGMAFPAAWQALDAPTAAECATDVFVDRPAKCGAQASGSCRPLLYAVGGVDPRDVALGGTRPDGRPTLAAPGSHGLVDDHVCKLHGRHGKNLPLPTVEDVGHYCSRYFDCELMGNAADAAVTADFPTPTLSGTSLSAAATSGVAAVVWSRNPAFKPADVMKATYDGGKGLGTLADACAFPGSCEIHRITLCGALAEAETYGHDAGLDAGALPFGQLDCPDDQAEKDARDDWVRKTETSSAVFVPQPAVTAPCPDPGCPPTGQDVYSLPEVAPFPSDDPCGECRLIINLSLMTAQSYVMVTSTLGSGLYISYPTMKVRDLTSGHSSYYRLASGNYYAGDLFRTVLPSSLAQDVKQNPNGYSIQILATLRGPRQSPVLVSGEYATYFR